MATTDRAIQMTDNRSAEQRVAPKRRYRTATVMVPREHVQAAIRVLKLLGGYLGGMGDVLMAHDGGMMTAKELKKHADAAAKMLRKDVRNDK